LQSFIEQLQISDRDIQELNVSILLLTISNMETFLDPNFVS